MRALPSLVRGRGTRKRLRALVLEDDGHHWLKYGEKQLVCPQRTRAYFKCARHKDVSCCAKKLVDFQGVGPTAHVLGTEYQGDHNHKAARKANTPAVPGPLGGPEFWREERERESEVEESEDGEGEGGEVEGGEESERPLLAKEEAEECLTPVRPRGTPTKRRSRTKRAPSAALLRSMGADGVLGPSKDAGEERRPGGPTPQLTWTSPSSPCTPLKAYSSASSGLALSPSRDAGGHVSTPSPSVSTDASFTPQSQSDPPQTPWWSTLTIPPSIITEHSLVHQGPGPEDRSKFPPHLSHSEEREPGTSIDHDRKERLPLPLFHVGKSPGACNVEASCSSKMAGACAESRESFCLFGGERSVTDVGPMCLSSSQAGTWADLGPIPLLEDVPLLWPDLPEFVPGYAMRCEPGVWAAPGAF